MSEDGPHIRFEMRSQARYLSSARAMAAAVAERYGFDDCTCGQIALAVDEALSNVIKHGYSREPEGRIWLSIDPIEREGRVEAIRIVIEDRAQQVELEKIKSRDLDDVRPGGLGVHIIRELMDSAEWCKRPEGGMRLTLLKRRNTDGSATTEPKKGDPP
ncbi:MAG: ATP-binding protein [Phycisphaerales bacterium JB038]